MFQPKVSIIIPLFNREDLIGHTLNSLISQSYHNWEAIVVDDGSSDESEKVIRNFIKNDNRFKFYNRNRLPKGAPTCRNIGVEKAAGDFIIFLDSDDLLAPFCLQQRVEHMQKNPSLKFAVFMGQLFNKTVGDSDKLINIPTKEDDLIRFLKQDTPWLICNPIWRRSALQQHHWREDLACFQDYLFHTEALLMNFPYHYVPAQPDCFWRRGDYGAISSSNKSLTQIISIKKVVDYLTQILETQSRLENYRSLVQSSYVDVIHRALNSNFFDYAKFLLKELGSKNLITTRQKACLYTYVRLYPNFKSSLSKKILKRIIRTLIGKEIFNKQYGTFVRVNKQDFFKEIYN